MVESMSSADRFINLSIFDEANTRDMKKSAQTLLSAILEPDKVIGFSAVAISVCALVVSFYEVRIMREWQQAALWPRVEAGEQYATRSFDGRDYRISVGNSGVGPAIVKGVRVDVGGVDYTTWRDAFAALLDEEALPSDFNGFSGIANIVLSADNEARVFTLNRQEYFDEIMSQRDRLNVYICYCDVFDQCWETRLRDRAFNEEVSHCEKNDYTFKE